MRRLFEFACIVAVPILIVQLTAHPSRLPGLPSIMLWAWETPQDLRFITPHTGVGVAFLERTISVSATSIEARPRLQPLRFNPGTDLMAVVRIESAGIGLASAAKVADAILPASRLPGIRALQIDFDARLSEREWYADLLRVLRLTIPRNLPLTITALESWCEEGGWLEDLPIADATAMLFRMGPEDRRAPIGFAARICQSSIGVSTDELPPHVPSPSRIYFFHPGPWTEEAYEVVLAQARRWRH